LVGMINWPCSMRGGSRQQLAAKIHDHMPLILAPTDCTRWLSDETDPHDLMRPVPRRADADVADLHARQQGRKRRPLDRRVA